MFMVEFGLGLVGRFAPQLNVFFLAMPIKSGVAIFMLILLIGLIFEYFDEILIDSILDSYTILGEIWRE